MIIVVLGQVAQHPRARWRFSSRASWSGAVRGPRLHWRRALVPSRMQATPTGRPGDSSLPDQVISKQWAGRRPNADMLRNRTHFPILPGAD